MTKLSPWGVGGIGRIMLRGVSDFLAKTVNTKEKITTTKWVWIVLVGLGLFKLWLLQSQALYAIGSSPHGDSSFLNLASNIVRGYWLGSYDDLTLATGPVYPLFVALAFAAGIPLLLAQNTLYILAALLFVIALRPLFKQPLLQLLIYVVVLFNPMSFSTDPATRTIPEGIYPALTLLVAAGAIGLLLRWNRPLANLVGWSIGLGLALSAFWLTREEQAWIIPLLAVTLVVAEILVWITKSGNYVGRLALFLLPLLILGASIQAVSRVNQNVYEVFTVTEPESQDFLNAYAALTRVLPLNSPPEISVSQEVRMEIYQASPAFAELKPYLEGDIGKQSNRPGEYLAGPGVWEPKSAGSDLGTASFIWALRDSVQAAGYYKTGGTAAGYYRRLATEVSQAIAEGKLAARGPRSRLVWHSQYLYPLLSSAGKACITVATFEGFNPEAMASVGSENMLRLFRDMTRERLNSTKLTIRGLATSPDPLTQWSVQDKNGQADNSARISLEPAATTGSSPAKTNTSSNATHFSITLNNSQGKYLSITAGSREPARVPLDGSLRSLASPALNLTLESFDKNSDVLRRQDKVGQFKTSLL